MEKGGAPFKPHAFKLPQVTPSRYYQCHLTLSEIWKQGSLERNSWRKLCSGVEKRDGGVGLPPAPTRQEWHQSSKARAPAEPTFCQDPSLPLAKLGSPEKGRGRDFRCTHAQVRYHLSGRFHLPAPQPLPCQPPSELTQQVKKGLELLVPALMDGPTPPTLTAPAPRLHLGGNRGESGQVLSVTHLIEGGGRWAGRAACREKRPQDLAPTPSPPQIQGVDEAGLTEDLQKVVRWAWRLGAAGGGRGGRRCSEQTETGLCAG